MFYDLTFTSVSDNVPSNINSLQLGNATNLRSNETEDFIIRLQDSAVMGNYPQKEFENKLLYTFNIFANFHSLIDHFPILVIR